MAASVEELKETMQSMVGQFAGFQEMMTTTLDKLSALEAWQTTAEESLGTLLQRSSATATRVEETASRVTRLEFRPPPPPPPPPPPHWNLRDPPTLPQTSPPSLDLNFAPAASTSTTPPRVDLPMGPGAQTHHRDDGGGLLGAPPPRPDNGTNNATVSQVPLSDNSSHHPPPFPKIEFPKFDGSNPRLWRDHCERYFEVYTVHQAMKTRFASLNFKGAAATWLQTVERRGRIGDWQ